MWHIAKREILDHMASLRFALTVVLVLVLFVANALVFTSSYRRRLEDYSKEVDRQLQSLREDSGNLGALIFLKNDRSIYKRPSHLAFCAEGQEKNLPRRVQLRSESGFISGSINYSYRTPWHIGYPYDKHLRNPKLPAFAELDWSFVIGVVMSFVAVLFTFDAISGERERGTLRLALSNPVPRGIMLLGKYLGALMGLGIPLALGLLLDLLIMNLAESISMDGSDWLRVGVMVVISIVYLSLFIWLGLLVSSRLSNSSMSLVILLLVWVILAVIIPSGIGALMYRSHSLPGSEEFSAQINAVQKELWEKIRSRGLTGEVPQRIHPPTAATLGWADCLRETYDTKAKLREEHLSRQFDQVRQVRTIARVSPTAVYQYTLEAMSGTGFARHQQFIAQVRQYREEFLEFVKNEDRKDPNSSHVYFLPETVSDKPVDFQNVPRFTERYSFDTALQTALWDMALLAGLNVLMLLAVVIAFLRADVR